MRSSVCMMLLKLEQSHMPVSRSDSDIPMHGNIVNPLPRICVWLVKISTLAYPAPFLLAHCRWRTSPFPPRVWKRWWAGIMNGVNFTFAAIIAAQIRTGWGSMVFFNLKVLFKVGLGIFDFCTHSRRLISKNRFPHPISVADAICGTRFDLRDSKRRALEN